VLPLHTFYGHDDGVTCVDACSHLDLVVSCGRDGSVIFHSLKKGKFIRAARVFNSLTHAPRLTWIGISASTYVICYCESTATLHLYSINGKYLQSALVGEKLECFTFSKVIESDMRQTS
jgi:WD40 repeat protein